MANYAKTIATNVRVMLHELDLTQSEFAQKAGITQPIVSKLLQGEFHNPQLKTLISIAEALERDVNWLLTDHQDMARNAPEPWESVLFDELRTAKSEILKAVQGLTASGDETLKRVEKFIAQKPENRQHLENFLDSMAVSTDGLLEQEKSKPVTSPSKKPKAR